VSACSATLLKNPSSFQKKLEKPFWGVPSRKQGPENVLRHCRNGLAHVDDLEHSLAFAARIFEKKCATNPLCAVETYEPRLLAINDLLTFPRVARAISGINPRLLSSIDRQDSGIERFQRGRQAPSNCARTIAPQHRQATLPYPVFSARRCSNKPQWALVISCLWGRGISTDFGPRAPPSPTLLMKAQPESSRRGTTRPE